MQMRAPTDNKPMADKITDYYNQKSNINRSIEDKDFELAGSLIYKAATSLSHIHILHYNTTNWQLDADNITIFNKEIDFINGTIWEHFYEQDILNDIILAKLPLPLSDLKRMPDPPRYGDSIARVPPESNWVFGARLALGGIGAGFFLSGIGNLAKAGSQVYSALGSKAAKAAIRKAGREAAKQATERAAKYAAKKAAKEAAKKALLKAALKSSQKLFSQGAVKIVGGGVAVAVVRSTSSNPAGGN